jgi:hypothetical protein
MIRRAATVVAALTVLFAPSSASASQRGWFPQKAGECGWVYGRYGVYNGAGLSRIWIVGTTHMINQRDSLPVPDELNLRSGSYPKLGGGVGDWVFGDFYVCAEDSYRRGHMQHVQIKRTRRLVLARTN